MRIQRAAKFGVIGGIGVTILSGGTVLMVQRAMADQIRSQDAALMGILVGVMGIILTTVLLFAVIGVYVDRKLEALGHTNRAE